MSDLARTTAVILAGGLGTRLRTVVADRPKVLAEVGGRPFLSCLLDQVRVAGDREVVLSTGYMGGLIEKTFGHMYDGLNLRYSQETTPLGTAGALRLAVEHIHSEVVLVMNGDSYWTADLSAFAVWHRWRASHASLALVHMSDPRSFGRVQLGPGDAIERFDEKGATTGPGWINAGVYLFASRQLMRIPSETALSLERDVFPAWVESGLWGYRCDAQLLDIGTPASYATATQFVNCLPTAAR